MEMNMVRRQRRKAKAFADALNEWDNFKAYMDLQLSTGMITKYEYDMKLADKANELDL